MLALRSLSADRYVMKIGGHELDFPVIQAALAGYSDLAMRRVSRMHGAAWTFDQVALDQLALMPGKHRRRLLKVRHDDHPLGGQLMGSDPDTMARAASAMLDAGYDWIDLNLACPVRKVLGRGRGGHLLAAPDTALAIIRLVRDALDGRCPLTIKMRRGWDDSPASERSFYAILHGAFEIGIDAAIVHPRTVKQRYVGPSRWEFLASVKRHVGDRTIIGSGDLFTADDVVRMIDRTDVDGVSLARGCIGNPWLFSDCRARLAGKPLPPPPTVPEQGATIAQHLAWLIEIHGERRGCCIMRKFGVKYSELHPNLLDVRNAVVRLKTPQQWQAMLDEWYAPEKSWPEVQRPTGPRDLVAAGADCLGDNDEEERDDVP